MTSSRWKTVGVVICALGMGGLLTSYVAVGQGATGSVGLGTADSYAVLAGQTITNVPPSVIDGDVGVHPGNTAPGLTQAQVNGAIHLGDAEALQAQSDLTTAYNDAAGRTPFTNVPAELGGTTLLPGVYRSPTLQITGPLTLDAQGDPSAVFIFQAGSTLITAPNSSVAVINGGQACNVFWQIGSSATLDVRTAFVGSVLALTSIAANTNAVIEGRLLARNGSVTLDQNTITRPRCATPPTTSTTTTSTTAPTGGTTPPTGGTTPPVTSGSPTFTGSSPAFVVPPPVFAPAPAYFATPVFIAGSSQPFAQNPYFAPPGSYPQAFPQQAFYPPGSYPQAVPQQTFPPVTAPPPVPTQTYWSTPMTTPPAWNTAPGAASPPSASSAPPGATTVAEAPPANAVPVATPNFTG